MKNTVSKASFAAIVIALLSLCGSNVAFAQTEGVEIKPAVIEDNVTPGSTYTFTVTVKNIADFEKTFFITTQDIKGIDNSGQPIFSTETEKTPYELSSWITLPATSVTLGAGESKQVSFTVRVPQDASPGSHFGGVFLDNTPPKQHVTGSAIGMKVGPIISLRIGGDVKEDAQLREFSTGHIVYGTAEVDFNAKVANLGNTLIRPRGLIEISDMRGSKIAQINVNDSGAAVFPESDKTYDEHWSYDGLAFGRYQAVISLVYGEDGHKTISAATSFWVLPLKPILTILGSIFGVLLVLYVLVRMYISRKLREMGGSRSDLYARRNQSPVPRLLVLALAILFLAIAFLVVLFLMFA